MNRRASSAFTIAELIIVVIVIGILAATVIVGYNGWQLSSRQSQVKSELIQAASAMEDYKNYNDSYPSTPPSSGYTPNSEVTIQVISNTSVSYCMNGTSNVITSVAYYMTSTFKDPQSGNCSSWTGGNSLSAPTNVSVNWASGSVTATWTAPGSLTGITKYTVECATDQGYQVNFLTTAVPVGTNQASFAASNASYFCRVRSTGSGLPSAWATN